MKKLLLLALLVPVSCTTATSKPDFRLVSLGGVDCRILYDGDTPLVRPGKVDRVFSAGKKCPNTLESAGGIAVNKQNRIEIDPKGNFVRLYSNPRKDTGVVTKLIIRKRDGRRTMGLYSYRGSFIKGQKR